MIIASKFYLVFINFIKVGDYTLITDLEDALIIIDSCSSELITDCVRDCKVAANVIKLDSVRTHGS